MNRFERDGREPYDLREEILLACQLQRGMVVADVGTGTGLFGSCSRNVLAREGRSSQSIFPTNLSNMFANAVRKQASIMSRH